jgi:hypothetical protein
LALAGSHGLGPEEKLPYRADVSGNRGTAALTFV